jgi:predicted DNA binding CopG/RHH family protein
MRIPQPLLDAVKAKAKAKGIPFTRYVRMLIEQDVMRS